jgi:DinB superfamily
VLGSWGFGIDNQIFVTNMNTQILQQNHQDFINYVGSLSEQEYEFAPLNKWTAGQQTEHIIKSVVPVANALAMPLEMLETTFGKANRPSASYDQLIAKYKTKLSEGGVAPSTFIPENQAFANREQLVQKLEKAVSNLCEKTANYSDEDLDSYVLPHPLLGKLTLREMLYFTAYHVQHHQTLIGKYLNS